jgi:hypothetical protein
MRLLLRQHLCAGSAGFVFTVYFYLQFRVGVGVGVIGYRYGYRIVAIK